MKKCLGVLVLMHSALYACPECRPIVEAGVWNEQFWDTLFVILLPVLIMTSLGVALHFARTTKRGGRKGAKKWNREPVLDH